MATIVKDLGAVTAYAYAKEKGYTGTEDEFAELMASYADVAEQAADSAAQAVASATAAEQAKANAASSASAAASSASTASTKASEAASSASSAAGSANTATIKANEASTSATNAASSASAAATSATNAGASATAAASLSTAASNAQAAAETAQGKAEDAQTAAEDAAASVSESAAQITQNAEDIADLKSATSNLYTPEKTMDEVYEYGEVSTDGNMYTVHPSGAPTNRARARIDSIQEVPDGAESVTVKISSESLANGKYKVGWAFYSYDFRQLTTTVRGWFTTNDQFTATIPQDAAFFMLYYATNSAASINLSEIENSKNSIIFDNDETDYAKALTAPVSVVNALDKADTINGITTFIQSINHRGYSAVAPEDTLPAFALSKKKGFGYVEADVSYTSDRVPVILHDETINRTARNPDGTAISSTISISDLTYDQALGYDFGIFMGQQYAGTKIPTFEQFILLCKKLSLRPVIELKSEATFSQSDVDGLIDILKKAQMYDKSMFISFSAPYLGYVKNTAPGIPLALAFGSAVTETQTKFNKAVASLKALRTGSNTVFASVGIQYMTSGFYETFETERIPLIAWTVNTKHDARNLDKGVVAVMSDCLHVGEVLVEETLALYGL